MNDRMFTRKFPYTNLSTYEEIPVSAPIELFLSNLFVP